MISDIARMLFGLILIYSTLAVVRVAARRTLWFRPWRPAYGWSLFVPFAALPAVLLTLLIRDWRAARNCILLGVVFVIVWRFAPVPAFIGYRLDARSIENIVARVSEMDAGRPFEWMARSYSFRNFVRPADKQRIREAWASTQRQYYTKMIETKAPGLGLSQTRAKLGYDRLKPSLQEQLDLAWHTLQKTQAHNGQRSEPRSAGGR